MRLRSVERVVEAEPTSDGAGVRLARSIGTRSLDHLDPFLLLDEFKSDQASDYKAGFPEHPHRGFETVTYMLVGSMRHADHRGHSGQLMAGGVQWMTAGRGIIHSEMPLQEQGLMWGFQLWINLPARDKMIEPRYQEFAPEAIPEVRGPQGTRVKIVAGSVEGVEGAVKGIATQPLYLDIALPAGARHVLELPAGHTACAYVFEGAVSVQGPEGAGQALATGHLGVLSEGEAVALAADRPARLLLLAAKPIGEPIARLGPFVMNTREQLQQAFDDFSNGRF